jgi:hypothetical protein
MAIWQSFSPQFWHQQFTPKKEETVRMSKAPTQASPMMSQSPITQNVRMPQTPMQTYAPVTKNPSNKFPWLEIEEEEYIKTEIDKMGVQWAERTYLEEEAYKTFMEAKQAKWFLNERAEVRKKIMAGAMSSWDKSQDKLIIKQSQLADSIREWALSSGIREVTSIDDDTVIKRAMEQKPELQKDYENFLSWGISPIEMYNKLTWQETIEEEWTEKITSKNMPMWQQKIANFARGVAWKEALSSDERQEAINKWQVKTLWKTMTEDMWAVPSVVAWAISAPLKAGATLIDLWGKLFWADINLNEWVNKLIDNVGVDRDGWFNAGKIAWEIWMSTIAVTKLLWWLSKVWQLGNLITKYPKIARYIARPVLEGMWYQWISDLGKWDMSSGKAYLMSTLFSVWASWLAGVFKAISNKMWPNTFYKNVAKEMDTKLADDVLEAAKEYKNNPMAANPMAKFITKLDDALGQVNTKKWYIGENLWKIRTQMKTIAHSTDDVVDKLNKALNENDIALKISKTSKWYKASGSLLKTEWKWTIIKDIVAEMNALKNIWAKDKLRWLDKINQEIIAFMKNTKMDSSLKNALWKASKEFTKTIDDVMANYWVAKWEYGKLANTEWLLKEISSSAGDKWIKLLQSFKWPNWPTELKELFTNLHKRGYTPKNLIYDLHWTNYIMW